MLTAAQRIARFAASLGHDDIPPEVREKAKVSLLHNMGVALAGGPLWGAARRWAEAEPELAAGGARLLLGGRRLAPGSAAFANAALMHARAQDDVYFPGLTHAGAMMSPAVLAVAEQHDLSGRDVVTALVAGYEAAGAIGQGLARRTTARGFRASGLYGVFASTVGVARLLGLGEAAMANAIAIAASAASGTNQTWISGTREWQFQVGFAARNGILCAGLAAAGGTGAPDALEGRAGFFAAFMGDCEGVEAIGQDLGRTWRSLDVTYKPYAVCAILQEPVRQAIRMAGRHDLRPEAIAAIRLRLNPAEAAYPGTDSTGPFSDVGATLMSAPFCLAVAFAERKVKGEDLKRLTDPGLMALTARGQVIADASLGPRSFVLEVDVAGGGTLTHAERTEGEPFNWDRHEVMENLRAMQDEIPADAGRLDELGRIVLAAERHAARDLVSAGILAG